MTTTAEPSVVDLGDCDWCGHAQFGHVRGRKACKDPACPCGEYKAPKQVKAKPATAQAEVVAELTRQSVELGTYDLAVPAAVVAVAPADEPVVEFVRPVGFASDIEQAERDELTGRAHPSLAEVEAEPEPVDEPVVADPAAQAEHARQVAAIDAQLAEPEPAERELDRVGEVIRSVGRSIAADISAVERQRDGAVAAAKRLARERTEAEVQRDQAYERVDELTAELGWIHAALGIEPDRDPVEVIEDRRVRLRDAETDLLNVRGILSPNGYPRRVPAYVDLVPTVAPAVRWVADRVDELEAHVARLLAHANAVGVDPARVLWQYDADQCQTCGSRFTRWVDHEHPLIPVSVLVVDRRREVPGAA